MTTVAEPQVFNMTDNDVADAKVVTPQDDTIQNITEDGEAKGGLRRGRSLVKSDAVKPRNILDTPLAQDGDASTAVGDESSEVSKSSTDVEKSEAKKNTWSKSMSSMWKKTKSNASKAAAATKSGCAKAATATKSGASKAYEATNKRFHKSGSKSLASPTPSDPNLDADGNAVAKDVEKEINDAEKKIENVTTDRRTEDDASKETVALKTIDEEATKEDAFSTQTQVDSASEPPATSPEPSAENVAKQSVAQMVAAMQKKVQDSSKQNADGENPKVISL
jgi:hypothetical protein